MMRWTHRQIGIATLGLAAVVAVIATGLLGDTGTPHPGPVGSGVTTMLDPPGDPADSPTHPDRRTVLTLGALNAPATTGSVSAPFDPCTVIDWSDLPTTVRPATATRPSPQKPEMGEDFVLGCRFDNSGPTTSDDHAAPGGEPGLFTVTLTWDTTPPGPLTASSDPAATAVLFGGRAGVQRQGTDPHGHRMCTGLMPVAAGAAGATVTNSRFPQTDPCTVVATALGAIASKVP